MTYREAFTALIQSLGQLYSDQGSIRRIVIQVSLPIEQVRFSGRADDTWADVLYKARRHNKVEDIFAVALGEYPVQSDLHTAVAAYREVVTRGELPPLPLRRCDFYAHVSLPPNFVARPALLSEVRDMLLATPTMALTSAIPMDALHGMGGIGKSVMARALCDDPDVQGAFPDGILWATIGQTPELIPRLREWVEELGGIIPQTAPTSNQLKQNLAELLADRACLLILDDVWHRSDVEPFLVGGVRCRLLLTTRDSEVARGLGGAVHPVPAMDPDEAVDLLELWAGSALRQTDATLKQRIVHGLGYLPLAIKLAGSQLQRKSPEGWLAGFDATQLQERRVEKVHDSLARTLALSLDELGVVERGLYVALAIFREDEATPLPGIGKLWAGLAGYTEHQAMDLVQDLAARALLQVTDGATVAVVIHDLLRDFMAAELEEAGRLTAHRAIVGAYRQTQAGAGWATAPDDGYLYDHLVYHLDQLADHEASAVTELQSLFANDAWLQVRVSGAGYLYDGYLADLEVVWSRAHQETLRQIEAGEAPVAFAECMRYALIQTSVNSLSSNYEPVLVAQAVKTGLWSAKRALSVALKIPDHKAHLNMLTAILTIDSLHPETHMLVAQASLAAVKAIENEWLRTEALVALAPQLSGELLAQGLVVALGIKSVWHRAEALTALVPCLSEKDRSQALTQGLAAARAIKDEQHRAQALTALAPHLSRESRAQALMQGLAAVRAIKDEQHRAQALAALAPHLSGEESAQALAQCLADARAIEDEEYRAQALTALAPHLSRESRAQALMQGLAAARAIEDERDRAQALAALAPHLSGEESAQALAQCLADARAIEDEEYRAQALTALAPHLSRESRAQALMQGLAAARAIEDQRDRAQALAALAPHLSRERRARVLTQGLAAARAIEDERDRAWALAVLAPQMSEDLLAQCLADVRAIEDERDRAWALAALAPHLSEEDRAQTLVQGLATAKTIEYTPERAQTMATLAPHLSGNLLEQGLADARAIEDEEYRAQALAALAPYLAGENKERALAQGLAAAGAIKYRPHRVRALTALAPHLSREDRIRALMQGLATALAIKNHQYRVQALTALAPHLSGEAKIQAVTQGLAAARAIAYTPDRTKALGALAPHLSRDLLMQVLADAQTIENKQHRVQVLATLVPHLSGKDRARAVAQGLTAARAIKYEPYHVKALAALAPYLSKEDRPRALAQGLAAAQAIENEKYHAQALAALAPYLSEEDRAQALMQGLADAQAIEDEEYRDQALAVLVPHLSANLLAQGLAIAQTITNEEYRAQVLVALAPHLPADLLTQGLVSAEAIKNDRFRALVLAALAPHLSGEILAKGLAVAQAIKNDAFRAQVQATFFRAVNDHGTLLREIRLAMANYLWNDLTYFERADLLVFCWRTGLYRPPIFDTDTLSRIASNIIEICEHWTWL